MNTNTNQQSSQEIICSHCFEINYRKNGFVWSHQRYYCKSCKRNFTMKPRRISKGIKFFATFLSLNNVGVRKTAKFLNISPPTVLRCIKSAHKDLKDNIVQFSGEECDIIELDEIYTYIKKNEIESQYGLLILENRSVLLRL
jgi:transposase-like protein